MVCGKEIGNIYGFRMGPINRQKNDPECRGGGGGADLNGKQASGGQAGRQTDRRKWRDHQSKHDNNKGGGKE